MFISVSSRACAYYNVLPYAAITLHASSCTDMHHPCIINLEISRCLELVKVGIPSVRRIFAMGIRCLRQNHSMLHAMVMYT